MVRPIQRSRAIRPEETEIFVLTGTLLWGIMIQVGMAYLFSDNPVTMRPLIAGVVNIFGVRTPTNEILIAVIAWAVIGLLWLLVNRTRTGKALLGASMNPRGVTLLGYELTRDLFRSRGRFTEFSPASPACCSRPSSASARPIPASSPPAPFRSSSSAGSAAFPDR